MPLDVGAVIERDGRTAVRFRPEFPVSRERLWEAVSTEAGLATWFPSRVTIDADAGIVTFSGDPHLADHTGTLLTFEPGSSLAFTWGENEVHLRVEESDGGSALELIDVLDSPDAAARNGAGWRECLSALDRSLGGPGESADWAALYERYRDAGWPSGAWVPDGALPIEERHRRDQEA